MFQLRERAHASRRSSEVNAMEEPLLLHHRDDRGVVTLTLNRPQAFNALSEAMLAALGEAVDDPLLSAAATQRRRLIAPRRRDFGK